MFKSYGKFWKNYVNFDGETSRPDYWFAFLMNAIIYFLLGILFFINVAITAKNGTYVETSDGFNFTANGEAFDYLWVIFFAIVLIFTLAIIIPSISIAVRRLRDAGYHWAFIFLDLIPWIGKIVLIILLCMPTSEDDTNMFTAHKRVNPDELEKWYKLKSEGAITQEEFDAKKKELF